LLCNEQELSGGSIIRKNRIIATWRRKMSFRNVKMRVFNMTSHSLTKIAEHLEHGEFTDPFSPPDTIMPDQFGEWRAESAGDIPIIGSILTGTEGSVDYQVDGREDRIHFEWTNPAVGNTFFGFPPPTQANGGPSEFIFFPLHFGLVANVEPAPGSDPQVIAVTQGDIDATGDHIGLILPFPGQEDIKPHAFFDVGLRDKQEPVSIRRWFKAVGLDPKVGLKDFLLKHISFKQLIELAF
jgi:hypothetical protein